MFITLAIEWPVYITLYLATSLIIMSISADMHMASVQLMRVNNHQYTFQSSDHKFLLDIVSLGGITTS